MRRARTRALCWGACQTSPVTAYYRGTAGMNNEEALAEGDLLEIVDAAWAEALGCPTSLLHDAGAHLVPGGAGLAGYRGLYMARLGRSVLVYAPPTHVGAARRALSAAAPEEIFSAESCLAIVVRYRALQTNLASLAVARSLGFVGRGENLAVRLRVG